jgi:glycerate kinase
MADGGEGTLDALVGAGGGTTRTIRVRGPLGDPTDAPLGLVSEDGKLLAIVESATASGLALLSESRRDPTRTTSRGTGDLIKAGLDEGASRILVCLGGSAVNDGGTGMAAALGMRFLNDEGGDLPPGGAGLVGLARIDASGLDPRLHKAQVIGVTDVDNVLTGPVGASFVFVERFVSPSAPVAYRIPASLRPRLRGRSVIVVDDVVNAGSAILATVAEIRACEAELVGFASLLVLGEALTRTTQQYGVPFFRLATLQRGLWSPESCPLCRAGEPLEDRLVTQPASRLLSDVV